MNDRKIIRVRDVMTDQFVLVDGMMPVSEALKAMKESRDRMLIINKRHDDDEYGVVLLNDIAREVLAKDRAPERVNVYEIMTKPVVGVDPDMDIRYCARLFDNLGFAYAPVIDKGGIQGVVGYAAMLLDGLCADS